ncbi:DUF370 domain-containing protein [Bacillus sp. V3B]|uniref:extracellular matrix regulator RemB n=1 Tax=Bacillus sp. V3B TaxID=2804915 RepID=UPI00210C0236|nr:extracellular matrix/biofilm biosynthesis regulator RemA family protein [Bacillus sp. V3B]MCQ6276641.1 DUF370 domain-containing protein [Bacillus sp. V3B]
MYIHFGEETIVKAKDIIAIIDKESFHSSAEMKHFFRQYENDSVQQTKNSFKSIIITTEHIYFSPLASSTLKKRSQKWFVSEF